MSTVFVCVVLLTTVAWIARVNGVAVVTVPTVQMPVADAYVPWLGLAVTKVNPAGSRSFTVTLVAESGPLLVRVIVKVMGSPTLGVLSLTVLASARSAFCGVSVAL